MITMSSNKTLLHFLLIFHLFSLTIATNSSTLSYAVYPFIRVYKNGTVERLLGTKTVPASFDPTTRVHSKDVEIYPKLNITARLYLPQNVTSMCKLPLLVYYHGGAFFTESPFSPTYHNFMNSLVGEANVVGVSVNYRLAPEHPLPIGYQDSWLALNWVFSQGNNGSEPWLKKYVDFRKVYVGGDSAGGNIAHNMAIRAGSGQTRRVVSLHGMFLNCPHFWGEKSIGNESKNPVLQALEESIWVHAYPNSTSFDDPLLNPGKDRNLSRLGCERVLVYVAEKDILRDRGLYYAKALKRSGWSGSVEVVEVKGEGHVFNLISPDNPKAKVMLKHVASFLKHG